MKKVSAVKKFFVLNFHRFLINKIFKPFININLKPLPFEIIKGTKCLVIAPHPDDESIGCGGIMNLYPKCFDILCLTHGSNPVRHEEFEKAMKILSPNNYGMMNLLDKDVISGYDEFKNIPIGEYDYIFVPYIYDQHRDHKAVSILLNKLLQDKIQKPKKSLKIVFYEVWSTINTPNYYTDISSVITKKILCISQHKSQDGANFAKRITGLNAYRGMLKSNEYSEAFLIMNYKDFCSTVDYLEQ